MSTVAKAATLLRLAARADWPTIRERWRHYTAPNRARRHGGRPFSHRDAGFPAVCHPDWPDSLAQFLSGGGDHWEMALLRRWLCPGDAAVDVGTNLGLYAFALADRVGPDGEVLAVDADLMIVEKLQVAARLLGARQLKPVQAAVADQSGSLTFYVRTDRSVTTEQSLQPSGELATGCTAVSTPALTVADLHNRLHRGESLAAVKVDIEGAEAMAFRAVPPPLLRSDGPFWIVEIHPAALARFRATPDEIVAWFPKDDFELWLMPKHPFDPVGSPSTLRPLTGSERFADSIYYNLLAVPRGRRWQQRRQDIADFLPLRG